MQWTLKQLVAQAALALSDVSFGQDSGRVSDVPTARTIRYYATHGLLDKALAFKGRTALYGQKHLLQIIAIKRLQSLGLTLDEIQARLAGLEPDALQEIARISINDSDISEPHTPSSSRINAPFWESVPAQSDLSDVPPSPLKPIQSSTPGPGIIQGLQLQEDVCLILQSPCRDIDVEDLDAIRAASEPLLALLRKRRLIK